MLSRQAYTVLHELVIPEATSPEDAARQAADVQRDPFHVATFYTVIPDSSGPVVGVDLAESWAHQMVAMSCQHHGCHRPAAPVLTSRVCFCWSHLAAYAAKQANHEIRLL